MTTRQYCGESGQCDGRAGIDTGLPIAASAASDEFLQKPAKFFEFLD
jgi:hypothetical protein